MQRCCPKPLQAPLGDRRVNLTLPTVHAAAAARRASRHHQVRKAVEGLQAECINSNPGLAAQPMQTCSPGHSPVGCLPIKAFEPIEDVATKAMAYRQPR